MEIHGIRGSVVDARFKLLLQFCAPIPQKEEWHFMGILFFNKWVHSCAGDSRMKSFYMRGNF